MIFIIKHMLIMVTIYLKGTEWENKSLEEIIVGNL